jgi:hypothetical protein
MLSFKHRHPADKTSRAGWPRKLAVSGAGLALIIGYWSVFSEFFPFARGGLGHDFTLGLPQLLSGYFWFRNNGLSEVLWFSPFICGGVPAFPHPIHFFYSLPQFLTFVVDPFTAVITNFLIFAALGFWGHYVLARRLLGASVAVALLGAVLFMFNGFYTYRYIIGHFLFHSFMLVPWCVLLLSAPVEGGRGDRFRNFSAICVGLALMMSYMVHSTLQNLMPAVLLSLAATSLICGLALGSRFSIGSWAARFFYAGLLAAAISAAKLSALFHFLSHVPRTGYSLPQFTDLDDLLVVLFRSLFFSPAWEKARQSMVNAQFILNRHEFEFGLTIVPLVLLAVGGAWSVWSLRSRKHPSPRLSPASRTLIPLAGIGIILLLPIALNYYTPAWNRLLKTVPIIGSSTQCVRWFCVYIPIITVLTVITMEKVPILKRFPKAISLTGIAGVLIFNQLADKSYYHQESYSPLPIMSMYYKVKDGQWEPAITDISVCTDSDGRPGIPVFRNDSLIYGQSQLLCYDSAFGYGLENMPFRQLTPGSVFKETDGFLNIKNPACYVFPEANDCRPGDHFTVAQKDQVRAFTHYQPYAFNMPLSQRIANRVSLVSLTAVGLFGLWYLACQGMAFGRRKTGSTGDSPV